MWASGLAAGGALVAWWDVVRKGYTWLAGAVAALVAVALALVSSSPWAWVGVVAAVAAALLAGNRLAASGALAVAAIVLVIAGLTEGSILPLLTGAIFLGGVTSEMMLGHWFLVDPQLPRWTLTALAWIGGGGLVADAALLVANGFGGRFGDDPIMGWAYVALAAMTALLVIAVVFALKEPSYTGVMAATGLSYLATLTAFGAAVAGRMVVA